MLHDKEVDRQIKSFNWDALLESNHLVAYDLMAKKFEDIYNKSKKKIKLRRRNVASPWIDKEIMELSYQKGVLFKQCRKNPDNTILKDEFKQLRNKLTAKIRLARKRYYLNQFSACRNNVKKTWGIVNNILGRAPTKNIDSTLNEAFPRVSDPELAENFNDHFAESVNKLHNQYRSQVSHTHSSAQNVHSAFMPSTNEVELQDVIKTMRITKSPGIDKIRIRDIIHNFEKLKKLLLFIINEIFLTGKIPDPMKVSMLRPLHKKGTKKDYSNYRPIAILSCITCIMEKIVYKNMNSFCTKYNLLNPAQFGFRSGISTITLLEDFNDFICHELDNNNVVLSLFVDLQKAFETVDHQLLLHKLYDIGFRGPYLSFFKNYFFNRVQCVKVGTSLSKNSAVNFGIPQGSVLGPLLSGYFEIAGNKNSISAHTYGCSSYNG